MDIKEKALDFAVNAHNGQVRKAQPDKPMIMHPITTANILDEYHADDDVIAAGYLHDVVEDTPYTFADLEQMGFGEDVLEALKLLTHDDAVDYMDYVAEIKKNPIATAVKMADLRHNSELSRLDEITEKALKRREKYLQAMALLEE